MPNGTTDESEDIKSEEEALKSTPEDELRSQVIEKYGLDPDANSELVDSIVTDKLEEQKKLSTAIRQKQTWRTKAQGTVPPVVSPVVEPTKPDDMVKTVESVLEKRELEDLEMSDELKKEVQDHARLKGISIKAALKTPYISFLKEQADKQERIEDASLGHKGRASTKKDYSDMKANDFDLTTPEGKAEFTKWEDYARKQLG